MWAHTLLSGVMFGIGISTSGLATSMFLFWCELS
ncbi:hypothetical protein J3D47_003650 [Pseudomonas laurylsulfativorans]|uniref:Uncharacterized protein n=1 Tax=Pseudomonas fluorescens TaxID=294 RepID=A0A5E6U9B0_PSEFL|nr:hypothetical protein [Pseudomonas laurylsulfativorans]VVM97665.1 hypothetical protein PS659_03188 [Pseudomonas fluorescens]